MRHLSKINHMWAHKSVPNIFQTNGITAIIFSDKNGVNLEARNKSFPIKFSCLEIEQEISKPMNQRKITCRSQMITHTCMLQLKACFKGIYSSNANITKET